MKIFLDLATPENPVRKTVQQVFETLGELEFVSTLQEADAIITDEPEKVLVYLANTTKKVAQVLWWKQKPASVPESERFKVFDVLPRKSVVLPGLIEAIAFLKGK